MRRYALALTLVASLAATASACPKDKDGEEEPPPPPPKPTCNLVVDPAGDALFQSSQLDILSGDVASSLERVAAVLRLKSLDGQEPATALGARWDFSFQIIPGVGRYTLSARREASGATTATLTRDGGTALPVQVTLDPSRSQVFWSAARSNFKELHPEVISKAYFFGFSARTYAGPLDLEADVAVTSTGKYIDGYPSCLKA